MLGPYNVCKYELWNENPQKENGQASMLDRADRKITPAFQEIMRDGHTLRPVLLKYTVEPLNPLIRFPRFESNAEETALGQLAVWQPYQAKHNLFYDFKSKNKLRIRRSK